MSDVNQKFIYDAQAEFPTHYYYALKGPSWSRFPSGSFGGGHPYWYVKCDVTYILDLDWF